MRAVSTEASGKQAGRGECTLKNSEEALFALVSAECVINREQVRLHLLELISEFRCNFGHWSYAERSKHDGRVEAVERAIRVIEAILGDDEEQMIFALDALAFHLGYRIKKGRFDDSLTPEQLVEEKRMQKCNITPPE